MISGILYTSPLAMKTPIAHLADQSGTRLRHMRGYLPAAAVGSVTEQDGALVARVRPDLAIVIGGEQQVDGEGLTVSDVTHGHGHMVLTAQNAQAVLSKICGLNFSDHAFPTMHAAYSSVAKVRTLIVRTDDAYHLLVGASYAAYLWDVVADALTHD